MPVPTRWKRRSRTRSPPEARSRWFTRTNSLILVDGPEQIAAIEKVIRQLDLETNQILIEAKLVQVESNALQELGINWSMSSGAGMGWKTAPSAGLGSNGNLAGGPFKGGNATINTPASKASQGVAFGLLNGNLGVAISHLLETGKAEVLATPQITTLDNKEARIFMGDQVPIQTKDVSGNTVTTMFNAGTELVVLPQITAPDRVLLNLKPKKDNYQVVAGAGVVIRKQEAETNVVVTDGETVVIGGLVERSENKSEAGVPLLKDIPLLGVLFRYTRHELVKKDLAIFVTPRIVRRGLVPMPTPVMDQDLARAATAPSAEPPAAVAAPTPPPPPPPPSPVSEAVPPPPVAPPAELYTAPAEPGAGPVN
jgi:type IV pilus secretin PilQ/predicted competence protein